MPLGALESVWPALTRTGRQLLNPIRPGFWFRIAVIVMTTGSLCGPWSLTSYGDYLPSRHNSVLAAVQPFVPQWLKWGPLLPYLEIIAVVIVLVALHWTYAASVSRFVLFETVLDGRCDFRQSWQRWKRSGFHYFLWTVMFFLAALGVYAIAPWASLGITIVAFLINSLARDFVIPLMALEHLGVIRGWRRLAHLVNQDKKGYAGYLVVKLIVSIGAAIFFGIGTTIVVIVAAIPLALIGVGLTHWWTAAAIAWTPLAISSVAILGMAALAYLLFIASYVSVPTAVFFQAYAIYFMAGRYPALAERISEVPAQPAVTHAPA